MISEEPIIMEMMMMRYNTTTPTTTAAAVHSKKTVSKVFGVPESVVSAIEEVKISQANDFEFRPTNLKKIFTKQKALVKNFRHTARAVRMLSTSEYLQMHPGLTLR